MVLCYFILGTWASVDLVPEEGLGTSFWPIWREDCVVSSCYSWYSFYKAAVSDALANTEPSLLGETEVGSCEPVRTILSSTYQHMNLPCVQSCLKTSSVPFSRLVVSDSLWPHELQHARPPCPSPTPRVYPNSCPSCQSCHPTISSSVIPFSSHLQSFPASGSFPMTQFFPSGGQSIGASASASVLPMNIQNWFPLGLTGWISLQFKGLSRVFSNTTVQKKKSICIYK